MNKRPSHVDKELIYAILVAELLNRFKKRYEATYPKKGDAATAGTVAASISKPQVKSR